MDASKWGYAAICDSDWIVGAFQKDVNKRLISQLGHHLCIPDDCICSGHINIQEMCAIIAAARTWTSTWRNGCIMFIMANCTIEAALSTGRSLCKEVMELLRELYWISFVCNFEYKAIYIKSKDNKLADALSRLEEPSSAERIRCINMTNYLCCSNIIYYSFCRTWETPTTTDRVSEESLYSQLHFGQEFSS